MNLQRGRLGKGLVTEATGIRLESGVQHFVLFQVRLGRVGVATHRTHVRFDPCVRLHVQPQLLQGPKEGRSEQLDE